MAESEAPQGEPVKVKGSAAIIIAFGDPDSTTPTVTVHGITKGQLYCAAWFLDQYASEVRQGELSQAALGGILPPDALAAVLRNAGLTPNGGKT